MQKVVSILGCGWVGRAVQEALEATYRVHCLSRSIEKNELNRVYVCDILLIAIPPRKNYLEVLSQTMHRVSKETQVIFLSSTSFYKNKERVVEGERLIKKLHKTVLILRLCGLMGYNRIAGKYTSGQTKEHDAWVNYVHRDDVVRIIQLSIEKKIKSMILDVTAPLHPKQSEIYTKNAQKFGWDNTFFASSEVYGYVVEGHLLEEVLDYIYLKPNPLEFWDDV